MSGLGMTRWKLDQKRQKNESDENGRTGRVGRKGMAVGAAEARARAGWVPRLGLGLGWACVREERRRDRDRMVRLALSPLLPRFPLLPVSCHAVPSCCRLPPAVPRCANEPLGGQRGDYDGTTLADLVYVPKRWALTGSLRPVAYARDRPGRVQSLSEVTVRSGREI